jgi:hypothetical protein
LRLGDTDNALEAFRYGLTISPEVELFEDMSRAYRVRSEPRQAEITLMEALVVDPSAARLASELVQLYKDFDRESCAVRNTGGSASLNLECPLVHDELCTAAHNVALRYNETAKRAQGAATAANAIKDFGCPASLFQ